MDPFSMSKMPEIEGVEGVHSEVPKTIRSAVKASLSGDCRRNRQARQERFAGIPASESFEHPPIIIPPAPRGTRNIKPELRDIRLVEWPVLHTSANRMYHPTLKVQPGRPLRIPNRHDPCGLNHLRHKLVSFRQTPRTSGELPRVSHLMRLENATRFCTAAHRVLSF